MSSNIRVFLDVTIGNKIGGRIVFELFNDVAPMAVENFRGLCTGEYGNAKKSGLPLSYKGCKFFKCCPGFIVQSGDFECNNGDGGESVYGGTFKDESFLRCHAQAGVLSMANKGRKTNGSQFLVTLKKAVQLDGKNVAFGQVVQGMEVLRAIEKCPIDGNSAPRVPIVITDCGELKKGPAVRRSDPKVQMRESVAVLMATLGGESENTSQSNLSDTQLGALKLRQVLEESHEVGGKPPLIRGSQKVEENQKRPASSVTEPELDEAYQATQQGKKRRVESQQEKNSDSEDVIEGQLNLEDERQRKLYELRLKLNQSKKLNAKEVANEAQQLRSTGPNDKYLTNKRLLKEALIDFDLTTLKKAVGKEKRTEDAGSSDEDEVENKKKKDNKPGLFPQYEILNETAAAIQWKDDCLRKKKSNAEKSFGWDALNTDSHYRAHKKRTRDLKLNTAAYTAQMLQLGEHFYNPTSVLVSAEFNPSEEAKERVAQEVERQNQKRKTFSRRRTYIEDENVGYINEYNRSFNKKLERAYGDQSAEIRQNLERGTAL